MNSTHVTVPIAPTPGLLVSMALRFDHSYGLDRVDHSPFGCTGYTPEGRQKLLKDMRKLHHELTLAFSTFHGDQVTLPVARPKELSGSDAQLYEEITGTGFYRPEKEAGYVAAQNGGLP